MEMLKKLNVDFDNLSTLSNDFELKCKEVNKLVYLSCPVKIRNKKFYNFFKENNAIIYEGYNCKIIVENNNFKLFIDNRIYEVSFLIDSIINITPTFNGLLCNVNGHSIHGKIKNIDNLSLRCNNRFLSLMIENNIPLFIIAPLFFNNNNANYLVPIEYQQQNNEILFSINSLESNKNNKLFFEITSYTEKCIFDTIVEEKRTDRNNIFTPISNVSKSENVLFRFNFIKFNKLVDKKIDKAFLYLKTFSSLDFHDFYIKTIQSIWCSVATTWNNLPIFSSNNLKDKCEIVDDYLKIDITDYLSDFSNLSNINNQGFILFAKTNNNLLCLSDCYAYPTIIEIITKM